MNRSLIETGGAVLCVSQFTLYGDVRRGRRPSFDRAAAPEAARELYEHFCTAVEARGVRCERGVFGARMRVSLTNEGPVTLILDSDELERPRRA
jgi:D-tyrosyl-tRNA(Tyr) deacylase